MDKVDNYDLYDFTLALYELIKKYKVNSQQIDQALVMIDLKKEGEKANESIQVRDSDE